MANPQVVGMKNPILDTRQYEAQFSDGEINTYRANTNVFCCLFANNSGEQQRAERDKKTTGRWRADKTDFEKGKIAK